MLTVIWTRRNKLQSNFNPNAIIFIQEKAFENAVCKMWLCQAFCSDLCLKVKLSQCQHHHHVCDFSADSTRKVYQRKLERLLRGEVWKQPVFDDGDGDYEEEEDDIIDGPEIIPPAQHLRWVVQ